MKLVDQARKLRDREITAQPRDRVPRFVVFELDWADDRPADDVWPVDGMMRRLTRRRRPR